MKKMRFLSLLLALVLALTLGVSAEGWEEKWTQEAPTVEIESVGTDRVVLKKVTGGIGNGEYAWGYTEAGPDVEWTTKRVFTGLEPGETYYFYARFAGDEEYEASPQSEPEQVTLEPELETIEDITVEAPSKTYDGQPAQVEVDIPRGANIYYREDRSGSYDLTEFPEYIDAGTYHVDYLVEMGGYADTTGSVTVKISPAVPTITLVDQTVDYTGKSQPMTGAKIRGVGGESYKGDVEYIYYTNSACTQGETSEAPTEPGTYYVVAAVPARGNYAAASSIAAKLTIQEKDGSQPGETTAPTTGAATFTIQATCGEGGVLEPSGAVVAPRGKNVSFSARPEKGYAIDDILVDGKSMGSVGVYTFRNIQGDHTFEVTFRRTIAETIAPTEESTEATTVPTQAPTTEAPTTEATAPTQPLPQQKPEKKSVPLIIPILMVILAAGAIGIGVYVYKKYDEE